MLYGASAALTLKTGCRSSQAASLANLASIETLRRTRGHSGRAYALVGRRADAERIAIIQWRPIPQAAIFTA